MKNVERTQRGFSVEKLGKTTPPGPFGFATASDVETHRFFDVLDSALEFVPVNESNADEMRAAGGVGLGPLKKGGRRASWLILDLGRYFGTRKVDKYAMKLGHVVNSWDISEGGGDERRYGGRWVERAAVAKVGIYALDPEEAVYPFTATGSRGRRISGANRYTITFDGKSMPPANAFWSITAYDAKTRLLTKNRIDRYLVNSPMLPGMKKSADGNVTIYIGSESPGGDLENNWLPTTKGDVFLVMRIYWPKTGAPSVLPPGRGSWKPPHLQLRK
jgi:hypothetical protein